MVITKIKPWAIYFTNSHDVRFLLHICTDGYESDIALYDRNLDKFGNYNLEFIVGKMHCGSYFNGFNYPRSITYSQIGDKELIEFLFDEFGALKFQEIRDRKGE